MKILFTYDYGEKLELIRELGHEVIIIPEKDLINSKDIEDIDILVCYNPFTNLDIDKLCKLRLIMLSSIGIDQLPSIDKLKDIIVTNNKGGYSIPIGEWVIMNILYFYKEVSHFYGSQKIKEWNPSTNVKELYGSKIGILGTGTIGTNIAKRLHGFDVDITGFNTTGNLVEPFNRCLKLNDIKNSLSEYDVIIVALPITNNTRGFINNEFLKMMKTGSVLINIARGDIIVEEDLINNASKFLGIALDVFEKEPIKKDNPLWNLDNIFISPHNSWMSQMRNNRRFDIIYDNILRFSKGNELLNVVDVKRGY
jgi:phosphoglycerate dehydrogenase-like enzyme